MINKNQETNEKISDSTVTITKKSVSKFLSSLNSHEIYDSEGLAKDFTMETGEQPCWPVHTVQETKKAISERGLGGRVNGNNGGCCYGWEVAAALAQKYAEYRSSKMGRGFLFNDCLTALQKGGH